MAIPSSECRTVGVKFLAPFALALALSAQWFPNPASAQEIDEDSVRQIVREEVERLLNAEGALDPAVERGIANFIRRQQEAAEQERIRQRQAQAANLRPVDLQRDHVFGNPDAAVTLLEYSDFECPYCKRFHPTVVELMQRNGDNLRWVYRHFPLDFHNPGAQKQAEATECVAELHGNDAFWTYSDLIYRRTESGGQGFPLEALRPLAEEIGMDGDAFDECLDSGRMADLVRQDHENGLRSGVSGTPSGFLVNRAGEVRFFSGVLPLEELQSLVDELLP